MSFSRLQPKYVTLTVSHQDFANQDIPIDAIIYETYPKPLIADSSDYVCAVERMEINGNAIPFYDSLNPLNNNQPENIILVRRGFTDQTTSTPVDQTAYSLSHLFSILNGLTYLAPGTDDPITLKFTMDENGFINMHIEESAYSFDDFTVVIPKFLNRILGLSVANQLEDPDAKDCRSAFPRLDCGDQLNHIVLATSINTISDSIGVAQANVLTDFAPETRYSNNLAYNDDGTFSASSFSTNLRQKIVYSPSERRYLDLISPFNVSYIRVEAYYVDDDGNSARVQLPYGCSFQLKLGFYKKV